MDAKEMMAKLNAYGERKAKDAADAAYWAQEAIISNGREVEALLPKLREIFPVVRSLLRQGLVQFHGLGHWNDLLTNGVDHNIGFYGSTTFGVSMFSWFGSEAGGACGNRNVMVNVDTGAWACRYCYDNGKLKPYAEMSLEEFAAECHGSHFVHSRMARLAEDVRKYLAMVEQIVAKVA